MKITTGMALVLTLGFLGLVGGLLAVILTGHDATGYVTTLGVLITTISGFYATLKVQKKQGEDIATVKSNTNGTLTALRDQVNSLQLKLNAALGHLEPEQAQNVLEQTITRDQLPPVAPTTPTTEGPVAP